MKRTHLVIAAAIALTLAAVFACWSPIGGIFLGLAQISWMESALQRPSVYEPVANRLALYCQSDRSAFPHYLTSAWFPKELRDLGYGMGTVDDTSARVELGGGFHHFGYNLALDASSSSNTTNVWQLWFYSESGGNKLLTTVSLPTSKQLAPEETMKLVAEGYDDRIAAGSESRREYQEKIQMYLRFDAVAPARESCREMLQQSPDNWWAVLVNALLAASLKTDAEGERLIIDWVNKEPNFFRYLDLAYYYELTNQPAKAAAAAQEAIRFNANTEWGHGGNSEYRGYTAAMYLYESGRYTECEQLCEKLIGVTINGDYAKRGLGNLLQATKQAQRGEVKKIEWDDAVSRFDPFESLDLEKLLNRP